MKTYIAYIDILGFGNIPKKLSKISGFEEDFIRENVLSTPFKNRIDSIKQNIDRSCNSISEIEGSDSYILIFNDILTLFESLGEISTIKIPHMHKMFEYVPLEIALGCKDISNSFYDLNSQTEIIEFLKQDIITPYRYYHEKCYGSKVKNTFIVITESLFNELEHHDKKNCELIEHNDNKFYLFDFDKILTRCRFFEFLNHIDVEKDNKNYNRIDEVYVEPTEFQDIKTSLEKDKVVFLTGPAEYGKTYTAVRLLWEYFCNGYTPKWVRGLEKEDRYEGRKKLHEIENVLEENTIIYFEDPFGRTDYECKDSILEEFMELPDIIKNYQDAYVIITSRKEIFDQYKINSTAELKTFERKLNMKRPSYDPLKKIKIIEKWAEYDSCIWLKNNSSKNFVFKSLEKNHILPTPLRLRQFTKHTINIVNESQLDNKLNEISQKIPIAFAYEIKKNMNRSKVLFLSYLFILRNFELEFIRTEYEKMIKKLNFENESFERQLNYFEDKIEINENKISFFNVTFSEALPYVLLEDDLITAQSREIFCPVLNELSKQKISISLVIKTIVFNNRILPESANDILIKLSENAEYVSHFIRNIIPHFEYLNVGIGRKILNNLLKHDKTPKEMVSVIRYNFYSLPEELLNSLLIQFLEYEDTHRDLKLILLNNFNDIDINVMETLLFGLLNKETSLDLSRILLKHFDQISKKNEILTKILEYDKILDNLFYILYLHFESFNVESIEELVLELFKFDKTHSYIVSFLKENFSKLSNKTRISLLSKLSVDEYHEEICFILSKNFVRLPGKFRNDLLLDLSQKEECALTVTEIIVYNYKILPSNIQNKVDELIYFFEYDLDDFNFFIHELILILLMSNEKRKAVDLLSKGLYLLNKNFVLDTLQILSKDPKNDIKLPAMILLHDIKSNSFFI